MGWSIANILNNVIIPPECADELERYNDDDLEISVYDGRLYFNPDDYEWMDYVGNKKVQRILRRHKVLGDITFGSLEGDNFGKFWGYRFYGDGTMDNLEGTINWSVKKS